MDTIFSSDDVHPRDRFDYWHNVACREIVPHHSEPDDPASFHARLSAAALDDIAVLQVESAPMIVERTERHVAKADHDDFLLCMQSEGAVSFQGVNDLTLRAGTATILDPSQSYVGRFEGNCRMLVARIPRRDLEARIGLTSHLALSELDSTNTDLQSAIRLLHSVVEAPKGTQQADAILRDAVLDLLALALNDQLQKTAKVSSARERTLIALRQAIHRNITDSDFSVADAAKSAGVSVRYANVLLSTQDTSLGRLILSMRLEKCATALRDPAQSHRSIQDIAFAWGFSDQSHFGKVFKRSFELAPRDYRAACKIARDVAREKGQ